MVLVVPAFKPSSKAARYKVILETPVASHAFAWLMPYKFDPEGSRNEDRFRYPFFEANSTREVFRLQDECSPSDVTAARGAYLLSAKHDGKVSTEFVAEQLEQSCRNQDIEFHSFSFDSKHAVIRSEQAPQVVSTIVEILDKSTD